MFHHAFKFVYSERINTLITEAQIKPPHALVGMDDSLWVDVRALWDTGATHTVLTLKIVKKLKLIPTGRVTVIGVTGEAEVNTYMVDIGLPNKIAIKNVPVSEGKIGGENIDLLIGMDIIQMGDMAISNPERKKTIFCYCFPPHNNPVDLVEKSERVNKKIRARKKSK